MAAPSRSTCAPWATIADVCAPCNDYTIDTALLEDCLQMATDILFSLSGSRYTGPCEDVVRPLGGLCGCGLPWEWQAPSLTNTGEIVATGWTGRAGFGGGCPRCRFPFRLRLPRTPVIEVTEVLIDGTAIDPARWRVDNYRDLVYQPESVSSTRQAWPYLQRIERPPSEVETWQITYTHGTLPNSGGRRAAAELGCQLALACSPATLGQCQLPKQVTNVARQGITIAVADPVKLVELFRNGGTGLAICDLWLGAEAARARMRPASVRVPGRRHGMARRTD